MEANVFENGVFEFLGDSYDDLLAFEVAIYVRGEDYPRVEMC
jgi:hypothetical protein